MKRAKGVVKNHVVVLEEGAHLPEGAEVEVRLRRSEADRRRKIREAIDRLRAHQITHPVGMDEVIEEMKRELNGELPDGEPHAS